MNIPEDVVGREGTISLVVSDALSAHAYGNEDLRVLATPALIGLMEQAAMRALDSLVEPGERSVGSVIEVTHLAPTPVGVTVDVRATIESVGDSKVWFAVEASDRSGQVAVGRHARFVVDEARFRRRLERAVQAAPAGEAPRQ